MTNSELKGIANAVRSVTSEMAVKQRFADGSIEQLQAMVRELTDRVRSLEDAMIAKGEAIRHSYPGGEKIIKAAGL